MQLPVSNFRQQQQADCLAACAAMVLTYLHIPVQYNRLLDTLKTAKIGTPFYNLALLASRGLYIHIGEGDLNILRNHLETGLPPIVAVYTRDLPHWKARTDLPREEKQVDHAIVVVGIDKPTDDIETTIYVNDPDLSDAPQSVPERAFMLAWAEHDYLYALIGLTPDI
jgi:ABC-type bacteriocin/lantibiotic exporter with double-glycine peptidase domain